MMNLIATTAMMYDLAEPVGTITTMLLVRVSRVFHLFLC